MYHYVRDSGSTAFPDIRALPPALFQQQLDWLQANYTLIGVADLEAAVSNGPPLPPRAALLTFDDGFVDHHSTVLPTLCERGLSGVFFLSRDACGETPMMLPVHKTHFLLARLGARAFGRAVLAECQAEHVSRLDGSAVFGADHWEQADERAIKNLLNYELPFDDANRVLDALFARHIGDSRAFARDLYLDAAMVREMADSGMTFGYHTRSHRMLSRLTGVEQAGELSGGVEWIRSLTGQPTVTFCYPWGGRGTYTPETLRLLDATGYSLAFNTERRRADVASDGRFELPRIDTRDLPPYTAGEPSAPETRATA
jgi:peptidoglycan/xylan/chitin deacetylase (PgdA/CDA1 family)